MPLPRSGQPAAEILEQLTALQADDVDWKSGRAFTLAYHAGDDVLALASEALTRFQSANALNVDAFPSLRTMQADVVAMVADLLHGGPEAAGFMTSGGTESILLAVKAARDARARARHRGAGDGAADDGACRVREGRRLLRREVGARAGRRRLPRRSGGDGGRRHARRPCCSSRSAPSYPQGVIDPVEDIAALAQAREHQLPRRRLHGRHHAADARAARRSAAAVRLPRRRA